MEGVEQFQVGTNGPFGRLFVRRVLAQVVEGDGQSLIDEGPGDLDGLCRGLTGHEAAHDIPAHRGGRDQPTDHVVAGRGVSGDEGGSRDGTLRSAARTVI